MIIHENEKYESSLEHPIQVYKPKKTKKILKGIAIAGLCLVTGVSSSGATYWLLSNTTTSQSKVVTTINNVSTSTLGVETLAEKASPSVVEIYTESLTYDMFGRRYTSEGAGSGVILTSDGYIVTNYHVIEDATSVTVRTNDGTEYKATVVGYVADQDLALLKIDSTNLSPVTIADSSDIKVGELAVAIGNPLGTLGGTVTEGIISSTDREITIDDTTLTLLQTSAAINPGNSGGGLFDGQGELIGIVNAKSSGSTIEGLGFAIPSNTMVEVILSIQNLELTYAS